MYEHSRAAHHLRWVAVALVMAGVLASPWLFGSSPPWAYLSVCLVICAGTGAWLVSLLADHRPRLCAPWLLAPALVLTALAVLQTAPLPTDVAEALNARPAGAQAEAARLLRATGTTEFLPVGTQPRLARATLAVSPGAARRSLYLLLAYAGAFFVLANAISNWQQLRAVGWAAAVVGFVMVVFALAQKFSGTRAIYWFHQPRFGGDIFGPFTNRNHFAAYMNMTIGVSLGLLLSSAPRGRAGEHRSLRERLVRLSSRAGGRLALLLFATGLMGAAVLVTLSRAGIASLAAALGLVGLVGLLYKGLAGRTIAAVAVLMLAGVTWLGWQPVAERLASLTRIGSDPSGIARLTAARDTFQLFRSSPVLGWGFGGFQHAFPQFQSPAIQPERWVHAHNDYAQLLAEGGLVGCGVVLVAACALVWTVWRRFGRASARCRRMVAGLVVGILAVTLHSTLDYVLHRPANAFFFAALCGMSVAALHLPPRLKSQSKAHGKPDRTRRTSLVGTASG